MLVPQPGRRKCTQLHNLSVVVVLIWTLHVGLASAQQIPIPDEAAQKAALVLVNEVYKADYDAAATDEQKIALARKMLQQGAAMRNDPAGHYVLFRTASDLAGKAGDIQLAFQAIDEMQKVYRLDAFKMKAAVIADAAKALRTAEEQQRIIKPALALIDEAVAKDDYEAAKAVGEIAIAAARRAKDTAVIKQVVQQTEQVKRIASSYAESQDSRELLAAKPTDPTANLTVGKFFCFVKGDWVTGIPMLALGKDNELKPLAIQELDAPADPLALGDAWWSLAESQDEAVGQRMRLHAIHWYNKALPSLSGLTKAKIEKRIGDAAESESLAASREVSEYKSPISTTKLPYHSQTAFFVAPHLPLATATAVPQIADGVLLGGATPAKRFEIEMGDYEWRDYDVHVECRHGGGESFLRVQCGVGSAERWDISMGAWGPKNVDVRAVVKGEQWWRTPSRRWRPNRLSGLTDEWYALDVSVRGTRLTVRIDGREIASTEHAKLTKGRVGMAFNNASWRNLEVRAPDGQLLWAGWPASLMSIVQTKQD